MTQHSFLKKKYLGFFAVALLALAMMPLAKAVPNTVLYDFVNQTSYPTVFDVSGSGNNGTMNNIGTGGSVAPTFSSVGASGSNGSAAFSGTIGEEVAISNPIDVSTNFSMSMDVRFTSTPAIGGIVMLWGVGNFGVNSNSGAFFYGLNITGAGGGTAQLYYNHGSGLNVLPGLSFLVDTANLNTWHTIGMTRTGTSITFSLDGSTVVNNSDNAITSSAFTSELGAYGFPSVEVGWNGNLDNFNFNYTPVPEPSVMALLGLSGMGGLMVILRRRSKMNRA